VEISTSRRREKLIIKKKSEIFAVAIIKPIESIELFKAAI
jgi:hypothetical protein